MSCTRVSVKDPALRNHYRHHWFSRTAALYSFIRSKEQCRRCHLIGLRIIYIRLPFLSTGQKHLLLAPAHSTVHCVAIWQSSQMTKLTSLDLVRTIRDFAAYTLHRQVRMHWQGEAQEKLLSESCPGALQAFCWWVYSLSCHRQ